MFSYTLLFRSGPPTGSADNTKSPKHAPVRPSTPYPVGRKGRKGQRCVQGVNAHVPEITKIERRVKSRDVMRTLSCGG